MNLEAVSDYAQVLIGDGFKESVLVDIDDYALEEELWDGYDYSSDSDLDDDADAPPVDGALSESTTIESSSLNDPR